MRSMCGNMLDEGPPKGEALPSHQIVNRSRIDDVQFFALMCVKRRALAWIELTKNERQTVVAVLFPINVNEPNSILVPLQADRISI
jgi:hypothetical protein